jgi:hypothetical protein
MLSRSGELGKLTFWVQKWLLDRLEARFGKPTCELVLWKLLHVLKHKRFWLLRMHAWGYMKNRKKRLLVAQVVIVNSFFSRAKYTRIYAHEQPWRPHGLPHVSVIVTKSAFTFTRKMFTPAVHGMNNAHLPQANASGCGRKISFDPLSWWHMMAIWGKQHINTYTTERSFMNTRTHRKRAVVSLTKARIICTNRTKKRNPTKPKSAKSTHPDEWMAQSRRETLNYAQGTLFRLVLCSCKVLG